MAYEESLKSITLDADASIALYTGVPNQPGSASPNIGHQYKFVKVTGRHQAGLASAGGQAIGVLQNKPQVLGQAATVGIFGVSVARSGGEIAAGAQVEVDGSGRGIAHDAGVVVGIAIEGAATADQLFSILLLPGGVTTIIND